MGSEQKSQAQVLREIDALIAAAEGDVTPVTPAVLALSTQGQLAVVGVKDDEVKVEFQKMSKEQIALNILSSVKTYMTMVAGGFQVQLNVVKCNNHIAELDQFLRSVSWEQDFKVQHLNGRLNEAIGLLAAAKAKLELANKKPIIQVLLERMGLLKS